MSKRKHASYFIDETDKERIIKISSFLNVSASWLVRELLRALPDKEILEKLGRGNKFAEWEESSGK